MNSRIMRVLSLLTVLLIVLLSAVCSVAQGGDGSGGGKDKPLDLAESSVVNGAEDVDPNVRIKLTFTKNVVNLSVRDNNKKCFKVVDSKGNQHPITVEMGDDQVNPDIKRIVTIVPDKPYVYGEKYTLVIGKDVTSKSGVSLGKDRFIGFTVKEASVITSAESESNVPGYSGTGNTGYTGNRASMPQITTAVRVTTATERATVTTAARKANPGPGTPGGGQTRAMQSLPVPVTVKTTASRPVAAQTVPSSESETEKTETAAATVSVTETVKETTTVRRSRATREKRTGEESSELSENTQVTTVLSLTETESVTASDSTVNGSASSHSKLLYALSGIIITAAVCTAVVLIIKKKR